MSYIQRNCTYRNGKRVLGSWRVHIKLPTGTEKITLKGVRDKKTANIFKQKANEVEQLARLYPEQKDWIVESYIALGQTDKIPNYNTTIPKIRIAYKQLIQDKLQYKAIKKESAVETYKYACELMVDVLGNVKVCQISSMDKPKFLTEFKKRGWSDNTINIRSRNMMLFFRWCKEMGYIKDIPFELKQISVAKRDDNWIQQYDFDLICSLVDKVYRAYFIVAYNTGLRLRELNTNPDDEMYRGLYHVLSRENDIWKIKVYGKGNKIASIILPDEFKSEYDVMVAHRRNPNNVSKAFRNACRTLGFGHYKFHDIRHSFCSNESLETDDAYLLSLKMRHSSLNTTQGYLNDNKLAWQKLVDNQRN